MTIPCRSNASPERADRARSRRSETTCALVTRRQPPNTMLSIWLWRGSPPQPLSAHALAIASKLESPEVAFELDGDEPRIAGRRERTSMVDEEVR